MPSCIVPAALRRWLDDLTGERLQLSPPEDPHAYALYFYTRAGDHIGWHYDTSYYAGKRYTLLLGLIDDSSCRLDYELHTRETGASVVVRIDQDSAWRFGAFRRRRSATPHQPFTRGRKRVSLTFEYVTDPRMHPWWRLISNMKDAFAYFGFRQVFHRFSGRAIDDADGELAVESRRAAFRGRAAVAGLARDPRGTGACRLGAAPGGAVSSAAARDRCSGHLRSDRTRLSRTPVRDSLLARWIGESANSLMPAGQLGGPVLWRAICRVAGCPWKKPLPRLPSAQRCRPSRKLRLPCWALSPLGAQTTSFLAGRAARAAALIASAFLAIQVGGFYLIQRRGLFSKLMQAVRRFSRKRDWSQWVASGTGYRSGGASHLSAQRSCDRELCRSSLVGWIVGTGEVFLDRQVPRHAGELARRFVLESLGQAIRGAGFAIPGALGVQEGGYLLLAPLAGLMPRCGLGAIAGEAGARIIAGVAWLAVPAIRLSRRCGALPVRRRP